jgi:transcriptional regulator with XRE-family HTH domain
MEKTKVSRESRNPKARPELLKIEELTSIAVGQRLEEYRKASGLKQADLVDLTGIGKDTMSRLFSPAPNNTMIPQTLTIFKVCETFIHKGINVDYNYVFKGKRDKQEETIQTCIGMLSSIIGYRDGLITPNIATDSRNDNEINKFMFYKDMPLTHNKTLGFNVRSLSYKSVEDNYAISRGRIYRIVNGDSYQAVDVDNECLMDYGFIERLKSQYRKIRPFLGNLSILSTNEFIWLSIMITLIEKTVSIRD